MYCFFIETSRDPPSSNPYFREVDFSESQMYGVPCQNWMEDIAKLYSIVELEVLPIFLHASIVTSKMLLEI